MRAGSTRSPSRNIPTRPTITTQPASVVIAEGETATFTVVASGSVPLYYRWRHNNDPMAKATNASLSLSGVTGSDAGGYTVVVTNAYGAITSSVASLNLVSVGGGGDDSMGQGSVPSNATNIVAIAAGAWHNVALRANGTVEAWGNNGNGQCDPPDQPGQDRRHRRRRLPQPRPHRGPDRHRLGRQHQAGNPPPPSGLSDVVAIAAGTWHSLALKADGSVVAWGDTTWGQTNRARQPDQRRRHRRRRQPFPRFARRRLGDRLG